MLILSAAVAALLVAAIRFGFAALGEGGGSTAYLPFLQTAVFVVSLFAFIKIGPMNAKTTGKYVLWSTVFLVVTIVLVAVINIAYTGKVFSSNKWLPDYVVLIIDFAAGCMFGLTFRIASGLFGRNASR